MHLRPLFTLVASAVLSACAAAPAAPPAPATSASPALFDKGMVSAADPRAAEAGAQILREGGNATDAAIATMLALNVVEPQSSGIGGGGFMTIGTYGGQVETLDGRETAPLGATPDWFLDENGKPLSFKEARLSGLSVGVPGNLALAAEAHRLHGKLAWSDLFQPAIRLAREGWTVTERFHDFLERSPESAARDPAAKALYFGADGKPLPVGSHVSNPALAATLENIAREGTDAFYKGARAEAIARKVANDTPRAGFESRRRPMMVADLTAYYAKERAPVCGTYRLYRICGMGPPSSGATTVIAILDQLEGFDLAALGPDSPVAWHLLAESERLAYADRERFLADSDFIAVPVLQLIDKGYLKRRGSLIHADSTIEDVRPGLDQPPADGMEPPEHGTSDFAVVDRDGTAVSYTSTIESPFGSGLMVDGFYLNNELTDFSFVGEKDGRLVANRVQGGKRPRSSMSPTLVYGPDGKLVLAIGAAGGGTIPVQVARALIGFIDWKLPIGEVLALPVLYSPGDTVVVEKGSSLEKMIPALKALGHKKVIAYRLPIKGNAIAVGKGTLSGAADPRTEGVAVSE